MDLYILSTAVLRFILFLIIQFITFRRINKQKVVKWIIYVFLLSGIISLIAEWILVNGHIDRTLITEEIISVFMYFFITVLYILGIFGLMISSLRIRILSMIVEAGESGIRESEILAVYNKKIIVSKRLERLLSTEDVTYKEGYYSRTNKFSIFLIHAKLLDVLRRVFS